ncbi:MAG: PrsW family intramembrane metalloprotease [Xanthomonadales bacterium]|nr:PrsW family intramembrane metalloprotease [Gammaproteobacteria bacterium]NND58281.1 PrsW family intramembrane metalloprotease [Xanthomonadales bacterium]
MGLLPVLIFLVVLVYMDSYKLVSLKNVLAVIFMGGLTAVAAMYINGWLLGVLDMPLKPYSRYVAPFVEEGLKALIIVYLFRTNRIGFLVDSAIMGFAVGAGFALVENFQYLQIYSTASFGVWIVRGFGTAIMHGGVVAIFAIMSQTLTERQMRINPLFYLPGLAVAVLLHSVFNHFLVAPVLQTIGTLFILPPLLQLVFQRSSKALHDWLELDFDADANLIEMIESGQFTESKIGQFLDDLRGKFEGPVLVDMLCYLRVYTELAIRAKAALIARENGIELPVGERTREKFEELHFLEKSIGKTGCLAMKPFLQIERKDLWQMHVISR